jgi:DNA invertase Pin-like site-specific DNA recombinase
MSRHAATFPIKPEDWAAYKAAYEAAQMALVPVAPARGPACHIYCRVSTERQSREGVSLESQRQMLLQAYKDERLEAKGVPLGEVLLDVASASRRPLLRRPQGKRLLEICQPGDHLMLVRVDRVFRSNHDYHNTIINFIQPRDIKLHFKESAGFPDGPIADYVMTIMVANAQLESAMNAARVKDNLRYLKSVGRPWCRVPPPGYTKWTDREGKKRWRFVEAEFIPYETAWNLRQQGYSWSQLSTAMEEARCRQMGVPFNPSAWNDRYYTLMRVRWLVRRYKHFYIDTGVRHPRLGAERVTGQAEGAPGESDEPANQLPGCNS